MPPGSRRGPSVKMLDSSYYFLKKITSLKLLLRNRMGAGMLCCAAVPGSQMLYQGARASLLVSDKALMMCSGCTLCISYVFCTSAVSFLPGLLKCCVDVT